MKYLYVLLFVLFILCVVLPPRPATPQNQSVVIVFAEKEQVLPSVKIPNPIIYKLALPPVATSTTKSVTIAEKTPRAAVETVSYEAANQQPAGRFAVWCVIKNRSKLTGKSVSAIAKDPDIFECRKPQISKRPKPIPASELVADFEKVKDDPKYKRVFQYATHFHNPAKGAPSYYWSKDVVKLGRIGDHSFYCFKAEYEQLKRMEQLT